MELWYLVSLVLTMALLSVSEAAAESGLSGSRIRKAIAARQIRAVRLEGMWLIDSESLAEFMAGRRGPGRPRMNGR